MTTQTLTALTALTAQSIQNAILQGMSASTPSREIGCCRVYVIISNRTPDAVIMRGKKAINAHNRAFVKDVLSLVETACKAAGKIWQYKAHYDFTNAIYIGYDNCSGIELGKAEAVAKNLTALGLSAYVDYGGD